VLLVVTILLAGSGVYTPTALATGSDPIRYAYDPAGRLTGVVDPSVGSASYQYDAAGNITAITRTVVGTLGVIGFTPLAAPIGAPVTISGTGFSATPANNTVKFNGVTATVTAASVTSLSVTVPTGATSGTISVTTAAVTVTSASTFRIAGGPAITSVTPAVVSAGSTVTVAGSGFDTSPLRNVVAFDAARAQVQSASGTSLSVVVPNTAASGHTTVSTSFGTTVSSADIFVPPTGYTTGDVQFTGRTTIGSSQVVTVSTALKVGMLLFDGTAGQRVSWQFPSVSISGLDVAIYAPDGSVLKAKANVDPGTFFEPLTLPMTGSYLVLVDPKTSSTGSATVQMYDVGADPTATATAGGSAVTITTTVPGQNALVTFSGTAGQRTSYAFSSISFANHLRVLKPDGTTLVGTDPFNGGASNFFDAITLPSTGTYTVVLDGNDAAIGSGTVQVYDVGSDPTVSTTPGWSAVTVTTTVPGQNALVTFSGTAGQRTSYVFSSISFANHLRVLKPDGTTLVGTDPFNGGTANFFDTIALPATGTYTVVIDGNGAAIGSGTVQVHDVPADASTSATVGGSAVTQTTTVPGQNGTITFSGTAGQRASWKFTNVTYADFDACLYKPDGSALKACADTASNSFYDTLTLPSTGTYTLKADPPSTYTGSYTLQVYDVPADASATATIGGSAVTQSTTVPGQNGTITFSGTAGQRASWKFTNVTYGGLFVTLLNPDGSVLKATANTASNAFYDTLTLPSTGTYTLSANPDKDQTGSYTVQIYDAPYVTSSLTIGGASTTITTSSPGQDAKITFSGTSSQGISLALTAVSISASDVSIQRPDGSNLVAPTLVTTTGKVITATLNVTGTYTILVNPRSTNTGSMTLALTQTAAIDGPELAVTLPPRSSGRTAASGPWLGRRGIALAAPRPVEVRTTTLNDDDDDDTWTPGPEHRHGDWRTGRARSSWQDQIPLKAPDGVTAVSGIVLDLRGRPLRGVTLEIEGVTATTDVTGRFLLVDPPVGTHVLEIDGATVAGRPLRAYGFFETSVDVYPSMTHALPYVVWLAALDRVHSVAIANPSTSEVVLTTPAIPGLEIHVPSGSTVEGEDEQPVTRLGITAIPTDRTPFPLPSNVQVPVYFTVQPGGAYVEPDGAWVVYPNYSDLEPGTRVDFWQYDPEDVRGWYVYGQGTVTPNRQQIVPDPTTRIWEFTGAMFGGVTPAGTAPKGDELDGDPVNLSTGLFVNTHTDLVVPDVMPLAVTRTYRQNDTSSRPFGRGTNWNFGIWLWSANQYQEVDLILPDSGRIHYVRTSAGTGWTDAAFASTSTPGPYFNSTIVWNGDGWDLSLSDGTVYVFGENAPLQQIQDRIGNRITITRAGSANGNITRVAGVNGHWIDFTYDGSNRVSTATDSAGRAVVYTYDAAGYLWKVTDPASGVTEYLYDGSGRMTSIKDARGITYLTNTYDGNGRVSHQAQADGSTFDFAYSLSGSSVTQTDVTDQRGFVRRVTFNAAGFSLTDTAAFGEAIAQTTTYTRQANTQLATSVTDALGRRTDLAYDADGHVTSVTRLAGTGGATTSTMTYETGHGLLATVTDPLSHTTTFGHDAKGNLTSVTDPRSKVTTFTYDSQGKVLTATDPTSKVTTFTYSLGDLVSVSDPAGNKARQLVDGVGRVIATTDPAGGITTTTYDALGRPTSVVDAIGGSTSFTYDANGNILTLTDPRGGVTTFTYDSMDRVATRVDALTHSESLSYDLAGFPIGHTDRRSLLTATEFDALGRPTLVGFNKVGSGGSATYDSTIAMTYDAANRLLTSVDSVSGTITYAYDDLDRLTSETSPQGTMAYAYDAADRRTGATLTGQAGVAYAYDAADRVTSITQGSTTVAYAYDDANRPTSMTYPNGIVATYWYDGATRLSGIEYKQGATVVGDLTYGFDLTGRRTTVAGGLARTALPAAVSSPTYNAANQLTSWNGASLTYDLDGNLTSDGNSTYAWNARGQTTAITGGTTASFIYDAAGRRINRTVAGTATNFAYDGVNGVQEQVGASPTSNQLAGGLDQTIRRIDGAGTRDLLVDALGSSAALVDTAGAIQTSYTYEPYGATSVTGTASANPSQFTGRENDGTGLYHYRARYYSPAMSRFISEDPAGFAAGDPNLYRYVGNDPINTIDPSGMFGPAISCALGALIDVGVSLAENAMSGRKPDLGDIAGSAVSGCVSGLVGFGLGKLLTRVARLVRINNPIPAVLARVVPGARPGVTTLGAHGAGDVFVTASDDIAGMSAEQIAKRLAIPPSDTFTVIKFPTPPFGIASPINRINPGFVGKGLTGGGAREFVLPNGPLPPGSVVRIIQ
jgi:RHS repeat-associated protein